MAERPVVRVNLKEVAGHFQELEDPRSTINRWHPLVSVVVIALTAVLGGASGPTGISEWANLKKGWLLRWLHLPEGIPQKGVYRRVLSALNPRAFQVAFADWLGTLRTQALQAAGVEGALSNRSSVSMGRLPAAATTAPAGWGPCTPSASGPPGWG